MPRRLPTMQATRSTLGAQQAGRQRARGLRPPLGNLAAVLALCLAASAGAQPDPWDDTPGALVRRRLPVAVPPPKPRPPPAPPPGAPPRPALPPPAAPLCALEVTVEQRATAQALELTVWMRNRSAAPLRFTLASACARPPVQVLGLPSSVDPFGTCNRGPCVQAQPQPVELAPGARQAVASGVVRYAGDSCSAPSAPGPRALGAALTFVGPAPRTCAPAAPPCPKAPPCALGCPAGVGYARDAQGCQRCACAYGLESPSLPPPPPPTRTSPPPLPPLRPPPPPTQPTQPLPPPPPPLRPPAPPPPTPSRPTRPPPPQARCPPPIPCGIGCPGGGGLAKDENGCTQCACDPSGPQVPSELNRR